MVISLIGVGKSITAALLNQIITASNQTAMTGLVPTSVAGTGVTVAPGGAITITNGTSMSVNGVFSGTFDNYRITWTSSTRSSTNSLGFRLRAAGTDLTAATYDFVRGVDSGTTRAVTSSSATTSPPIDLGIAAGMTSNGVVDLFGPALVAPTTAQVQATLLSASVMSSSQVGFVAESTAAYDGFTIAVTSPNTWSGVVRVYGYNNLTG